MRFLFTCGGTAGHIYPAVGVAEKLAELYPGSEFLFVGARGMMETELVPREGYRIETVTITNIHRSLKPKEILHNLKTVKNVFAATHQAKRIISEFNPDVAIGTGGYVCYPVLRAAHSMGIPTLVHESNAVPGLTTKLLSKIVDCVMVGFEDAKKNYDSGIRVEFVGTPVREQFTSLDKAQARRELGIDEGKRLVLSVWGSLGSEYMNGVMTELIAIDAEKKDFALIHSAGKKRYPRMKAALDEKAPGFEKADIDVRPYIYDMPKVMAAADVIICRSGASTLGELTALGRPAVLIPSPNVTGNHQEKNARVLEKQGAAVVLLEGEFTPETLYDELCTLLKDSERCKKMSDAMLASGLPDSAERIASLVMELAEKK